MTAYLSHRHIAAIHSACCWWASERTASRPCASCGPDSRRFLPPRPYSVAGNHSFPIPRPVSDFTIAEYWLGSSSDWVAGCLGPRTVLPVRALRSRLAQVAARSTRLPFPAIQAEHPQYWPGPAPHSVLLRCPHRCLLPLRSLHGCSPDFVDTVLYCERAAPDSTSWSRPQTWSPPHSATSTLSPSSTQEKSPRIEAGRTLSSGPTRSCSRDQGARCGSRSADSTHLGCSCRTGSTRWRLPTRIVLWTTRRGTVLWRRVRSAPRRLLGRCTYWRRIGISGSVLWCTYPNTWLTIWCDRRPWITVLYSSRRRSTSRLLCRYTSRRTSESSTTVISRCTSSSKSPKPSWLTRT